MRALGESQTCLLNFTLLSTILNGINGPPQQAAEKSKNKQKLQRAAARKHILSSQGHPLAAARSLARGQHRLRFRELSNNQQLPTKIIRKTVGPLKDTLAQNLKHALYAESDKCPNWVIVGTYPTREQAKDELDKIRSKLLDNYQENMESLAAPSFVEKHIPAIFAILMIGQLERM